MNASAVRMPLKGSPPTFQYGLPVIIFVFFFAAVLKVPFYTGFTSAISLVLLYYCYAGTMISILAIPAFPTTKN